MRILVAALAASLTAGLTYPALAIDGTQVPPAATPRETTPDVPTETPARGQQLDQLFAQLKAAADDDSARSVEASIQAIWIQSGSATADLLMSWTVDAMQRKNYGAALDYLDRIITLQPDYTEAWNRRATVYYLTDQYARALSDIEHVLALEPRHFVALAGLGTILRTLGEDERALQAYREALAIDPRLEDVDKAVKELTSEGVGGRSL